MSKAGGPEKIYKMGMATQGLPIEEEFKPFAHYGNEQQLAHFHFVVVV